jgi:ABC-type transport system substrate-binding protein
MGARGGASRAATALALAAVVLAACTGGDDPGATTTTKGGDAGEIVEGGQVRLGLAGPVVADPAAANLASPSDLLVLDLLHDGLTRLDDSGTPAPALARSWTPDATLTSWTFALDTDATFTSGDPVTATDVVLSLERVAKGGDASLAALRLEAIAGFRDFVAGTTEHLAGLSAPDPATVTISLNTPVSVLPTILASPVYGVVAAPSLDAAAGAGELGDLALSGAWVVASASDSSVLLERRDDAPGHLDGVELRSYDDADAAYEGFDDGQVDWSLVPADRYGDAVDEHGDEHFAPFHAELFFGLRVTSPTLANVELRRAVAAAIDPAALVDAVYADLADPLATVVPNGVPGHDDDVCPDCGYDPDRAKAVLAAAFPDGAVPTVNIDFDESATQEAMARVVAEDLAAVGIPTALRPLPIEDYARFVVTGGQELFSFGWIGGYGSPDAYLAPLFGSAADDNLTGYGTATVDAALAAARATADRPAAAAQWAAAEAQVLSEAVVVPVAQFRTQAVVAERVQAFAHAVDGTVDWSAVWVSDGD